ncbi:MAG TPA: endo-1,3-alpha-glucanase family glycosylhydrolase [Armatimonadota bacterium]|jgi:hypothetical protein
MFRSACICALVLLTCLLQGVVGAEAPMPTPAVWTSDAATRTVPESETRFRLQPGEQMTIVAQVRMPAGMANNASIARTSGWQFGVRPDGALFFSLAGRGSRTSEAVAEADVLPLYLPSNTVWPVGVTSGRMKPDTWTSVAWAVDTQGDWGKSYTFYLDGSAQGDSMGYAPLTAPASQGPVQIGGEAQGLEIREVRCYTHRLSAAELARIIDAKTKAVDAPVKIPQRLTPRPANTRLIIAHRMIGFGPSAASSQPASRAIGAGGFIEPVKRPNGPNLTGWCRDTHIGALHPPFANAVDEYKWEIAQAYGSGVDAFVFDTCGSIQDLGIPEKMLQAAEELGGNFKVGLCYDFAGGSIEQKVESITYWMGRHRQSPALLRLDGRPAFVTYMGIRSKPAEVKQWFDALRTAAGEPIFMHMDRCEFPLLGKTPQEWEAAIQPYLSFVDGVGCFYSREGIAKDTQAFTALAHAAHTAGKRWGMSPWANYYTPGRSSGMENIGADNSRLWDQMWRVARDTQADYILMSTWNDITEDTSVMPSVRHHFSYVDLLANYYGPWYRTGVEPKATHDQVYVFYRPYRTDARVPLVAGPYTPGRETQNQLEVRAFLTAPGTVVVEGMGRQDVPAGMSSVEFASKPGPVTVSLLRNSKTVLTFRAPEVITDRPWRQDFSIRGFSSEEAAHWTQWFSGAPHYISEYGDDDHNGLPNWFERYYFGRWTGTDPQADPDGDGRTNLQEYQEGADPLTPPVNYAAGYVWDAAKDFSAKDATYPVLDAKGTPVWQYEFLARTGHPALPRTGRFAAPGLLVSAIPAWLEWGGSWGFGIGQPQAGRLAYSGEADSAASQVWISPISGHITLALTVSRDAAPWATTSVTVSLLREGDPQPLWSADFTPQGEPLSLTRELPVQRGERLRLVVAGKSATAARWAVQVAWTLTRLRDEKQ